MGRTESPTRNGWIEKFAADGMTVEPAARSARRKLNGDCMPVTLSAGGVVPSALFFGGRHEWTTHQAFDPNRDNRDFGRGSFGA